MQRNDSLLIDMADAARLILKFRGDLTFDQFRADRKTQSAMIHQFLVIGEVAKLLSEDFRKSNPQVPWSAMARMRDKLIHHYRGVDFKEIWNAAQTEIPRLLAFLENQIPNKPS
jgi:uncharacterized protein with HEPN domain